MTTTFKFMAALAAALLLAACGGGGGADDASPMAPAAASDSVPASASRSVPEMIAWLVALGGANNEAKEPLEAETFAPPAPNDAESSPLAS